MGLLDLEGMPPIKEWRAWLKVAASHDAHPLIQFVKYGLAGVGALATDLLFFYLAEAFLFPVDPDTDGIGFRGIDQILPWLSDLMAEESVRHYALNSCVGFVFSCAVAYLLNIKWVFKPGKHSRHKEITLFFVVAVVAFVLGTALGSFLVGSFGWSIHFAKAGNIVAAILINYLCRKFLIFHG